jgi:hypothetical protein
MAEHRYILDADVFITAKNRYYGFDTCPGFWASIIHYHRAERLYSIDRVRSELLAGQPAPESKTEIKLPDVCMQFQVGYVDTFRMLNDLAVRFEWAGAT